MKTTIQYIKYLFACSVIILFAITLIHTCASGLQIIEQAFNWADGFESFCLSNENLRG